MRNGSPVERLPNRQAARDARRWFFSIHAQRRMVETAVPRGDVVAVLNEAEVYYPVGAWPCEAV